MILVGREESRSCPSCCRLRAGRTDKSGEWTSKGVGKYLEGGKDAGGMLVDQRFCPRIVEGELRYNCIGPQLVGIIHKKPKEGGISAVGGTGSVYTCAPPCLRPPSSHRARAPARTR